MQTSLGEGWVPYSSLSEGGFSKPLFGHRQIARAESALHSPIVSSCFKLVEG